MIFNHYAELGPAFAQPTQPRSPPNPHLFAWNEELARELELANLDVKTRTDWFSGKALPPHSQPVAAAYAGHQFAHFVPVLGDGRALLLGELKSLSGEYFDIQLKGAGPTVFSRGGDGFAALGPVIREYLLSEFMHAVQVPTTRALAACLTGATVQRQSLHPGAVLTRVATSHIRIGSFEYHRYKDDFAALGKLLEYCLQRHYPELQNSARPAFDFFARVSHGLADLVSDWMSLGFIHGVLNTDNTSVAGITLDYGPCAYLDEYNPEKVFSSIDRSGRYRFSQQAAVLQWNLARLADCLLPLETADIANLTQAQIDPYNQVIEDFLIQAKRLTQKKLARKLGLNKHPENIFPEEAALLDLWLELLQEHSLDYTCTWKALEALHLEKSLEAWPALPLQAEKFKTFFNLWKLQNPNPQLLAKNPYYIPRNHMVEKVISLAEAGDFSLFHELHDCLKNPFLPPQSGAHSNSHSNAENWKLFAMPPRPEERVQQTFCGT